MQWERNTMDTTTIADVLSVSRTDANLMATRQLFQHLRECLNNVTGDLVSIWRTLEEMPGAISELAAQLLGDAGDSASHVNEPIWEAPRTAYLLTAAIADSDHAEADAFWKPLDKPGQADLLLALAAQLKANLLTVLSATGTDSGRYALAWALATMSADVSAAHGIPRDVFAQTCRNIAGRPADH
jgi:hypothetical protein